MAEAFKMGDAFVEVGLRPPTKTDEEKVRTQTETGLGKNPPKIPVKLRDPVDAAFRARLNSELQAAAKHLAGLPITPDFERFRRDTATQIRAITKTLEADIPLDVANAAEWRAKVAAEAAAVSKSVQAHIPVEVEVDKKSQTFTRRNLIKWAAGVAAVVGPAGVIGGALAGTAAVFGAMDVAAASTDATVGDAFDHLTQHVRDDIIKFSEPMTPALVGIAHQAENTFSLVEGSISKAMATAVPEVQDLADGVLKMSRTALPGFTTALQRSGPVVRELDDDLGRLGHSVSGFLIGLSSGVGGAATGLHALFSDVDAILPPLGRFVGSLAEVTGTVVADFVPAFEVAGTVLDGVSVVLDHTESVLGPVTAAVLAGAVAWKTWSGIKSIASTVTDTVGKIVDGVDGLRKAALATEAAEEGVATATSIMSVAAGGVIVLLAGLAVALVEAKRKEKDFGDQAKTLASDLLTGGRSAAEAAKKVGELGEALSLQGKAGDHALTAIDRVSSSTENMFGTQIKATDRLNVLSDALGINARSAKDVTKAITQTKTALDDQLDSMHATPLAVESINTSFDAYVAAAKRHGGASDQAKTALDILKGQIDKANTASQNLDSGLGDTTNWDIATSAADALDTSLLGIVTSSAAVTLGLQRQQVVQDGFAADIALRQAIDATAQAQKNYAKTLKDNGPNSQAAKQASDQLLASMQGQAEAAQNAAEANYTGTDAEGKAAAGAAAYRQTLVNLAAHASGPLKDALLGTIRRLDDAAKPRVTDLYADITNAEQGIAKAQKGYDSLPKAKKAKIDADIVALQHKIAVANHAIQSMHSKTIGIDVNIITHGNQIIVGLLGKGPHALAAGGVVKPIHGGQVVRVAEAGVPEAVIPLDRRGEKFLRRSLGPLLQPAATQAPAVAPKAGVPGQTVSIANVTVQVQADSLRKVADVVKLFEGLGQAARAGGVFA